jgi:hypothetical protein
VLHKGRTTQSWKHPTYRADINGMALVIILVCFAFALCVARPLVRVPTLGNDAICNDGSPYVYYLRRGSMKHNVLLFLQGGAWCFDLVSCQERWTQTPDLMSSKGYPATLNMDAILSDNNSFNPLFANWTHVFFPYCTSDDFSGNASATSTPWSFL